jgi:amino acid transporter
MHSDDVQEKQPALIRTVGRWDLTALAVNGVIGSSMFGLPAGVAALVGPWGPVACLLCGIFILLIVLCFAEASSLFTGTGGPYLYAKEAFGKRTALAAGWMMWLARVTAFAANANLLVSFMAYFLPAAGSGIPRALLMAAVVAFLAWLNLRGVSQGALAGDVLAALKMVPLAAFVVAGLFAVRADLLLSGPRPEFSGFGEAILLYVFAFTGFEFAAIPAGEALAPKRHLPAAMLTALFTACILYTGIQTVCQGTLPGLADSRTAMADAARTFIGPIGGSIIAVTAILSIMGNLSGMALVAPRLTFALAQDGLLPGALARVHRRHRTPHVSIFIFAASALLLAWTGTFVGMVRVSAVARIVPYVLTCLAVPVLRRKRREEPDRFRLRAGMLIPGVALLLCLGLLTQSPPADLLAAAAALAAGYLLSFGTKLRRVRAEGRPAGR